MDAKQCMPNNGCQTMDASMPETTCVRTNEFSKQICVEPWKLASYNQCMFLYLAQCFKFKKKKKLIVARSQITDVNTL